MNETSLGSIPKDYQSTLSYYKDKVDDLSKERLGWLSKLDECNSHLNYKQQKQQKLKKIKDDIDDTSKSIIHHSVACYDELSNIVALQRNNTALEYEDAEQILRMKELTQEYPQVIPKQIPCTHVCLSDQLIQNDLNIHYHVHPNVGKTKKVPVKAEKKSKEYRVVENKPFQITLEGLLKRQISDIKGLNDQEVKIMEDQIDDLEDKIKTLKKEERKKIAAERQVIKEFQDKFNKLDKKHKKLAEAYFDRKRKRKENESKCKKQNQELKETFDNIQKQVAKELRIYEKQTKAKQALIIKRSRDFQEDYKARMRAKERNLQALKDNYEKMQQLCIIKVRKLQATVEKAKNLLKDTEEARKFTIGELREDLRILQKKDAQQRLQRAKLDQKIKLKLQEQKLREEVQRQKMEKTKRLEERDRKIVTAYQKTRKSNKKSQSKGKRRTNFEYQQNQEEQDSLDMSDIDKIRQEINQLQKKITQQDKHYQ